METTGSHARSGLRPPFEYQTLLSIDVLPLQPFLQPSILAVLETNVSNFLRISQVAGTSCPSHVFDRPYVTRASRCLRSCGVLFWVSWRRLRCAGCGTPGAAKKSVSGVRRGCRRTGIPHSRGAMIRGDPVTRISDLRRCNSPCTRRIRRSRTALSQLTGVNQATLPRPCSRCRATLPRPCSRWLLSSRAVCPSTPRPSRLRVGLSSETHLASTASRTAGPGNREPARRHVASPDPGTL